MPALDFELPEQTTSNSAVETDLSVLAGESPLWKGLVPDESKAYVEFDICHSLPNVIGPEMHGRIFGYHPQVLSVSHESLFHQQVNLGHLLKAYGHHEDRIVGAIVGVAFPKLQYGRSWEIPETESEAPHIRAVAVIHKVANGVDRLLGRHLTGRQRQSVSIESIAPTADYMVYNPGDASFTGLEDAFDKYGDAIWFDEKNGLLVGKYEGKQLVLMPGGMGKKISFRGTGFTPTPAEKIAKITDLRAEMEVGGFTMIAAVASYDWEAGGRVKWQPVFRGMDAGFGTITEVICEGEVMDHSTRKVATPEDPLLRVKVFGKVTEVFRHASSVEKI